MAEPNWKNRTLYHGDNLDFLRGMNSESVHLIATDPPFNKGRDFHATPDSLAAGARFQDRWRWDEDIEGAWVDQIQDDWPAVWEVIDAARVTWGDDMAAFCCFMAVRLIEMRRVLRADGSLYLHCDPTASHYLKLILDAVFGRRNMRNELIWCYTDPAGRRNARHYKKTHDTVFWYTKNTRQCRVYTIARAPLAESTVRRYGKYFDIHGQITYERLRETNPGVFEALKSVPEDLSEVWLDKNRGPTAADWWADITPIKRKGGRQQSESTGFPTQKPISLLLRILETSSDTGNIVLDPFAGCATTLVTAERLGRQWVGIDIWDGAYRVVRQRMQDSRQLLTDRSPDIHLESEPPTRTDHGIEAVPFLQVTELYAEPPGPRMTRAEMVEYLLKQRGMKCQGCDREFDDPRYLELDHNTPRSDGGLNHITNRVLLCSPCNRAKSNTYTLSGLRRLNRRNNWMRKDDT